jgi:hypothetical protein
MAHEYSRMKTLKAIIYTVLGNWVNERLIRANPNDIVFSFVNIRVIRG